MYHQMPLHCVFLPVETGTSGVCLAMTLFVTAMHCGCGSSSTPPWSRHPLPVHPRLTWPDNSSLTWTLKSSLVVREGIKVYVCTYVSKGTYMVDARMVQHVVVVGAWLIYLLNLGYAVLYACSHTGDAEMVMDVSPQCDDVYLKTGDCLKLTCTTFPSAQVSWIRVSCVGETSLVCTYIVHTYVHVYV